MSRDKEITIGVCTFRRPQVAETVQSLFKLEIPKGFDVSVLVIDNDQEPSAQKQIENLARFAPFPVRYIHAPAGNISIARNGALENCKTRYLAFIDDDEIATEGWLKGLLQVARTEAADVVLGPVEALYRKSAPDWMKKSAIHSTKPVWVNNKIITGYSCNVLIDLDSQAANDIRFDLMLGQSGGEDTKYFSQLSQNGGKISYAAGAIIYEDVTENRATYSWLVQRRFRMGQTHGRLLRENRPDLSAGIAAMVPVLGKIVYCFASAIMSGLNETRRNGAILRGLMHVGVLFGLMGIRELKLYGSELPGQVTSKVSAES